MYVFIFLVKVTEWPPIGKIAAHSAYEMFSWYKYLIVSLVFSHLGFWSGNLFLIAPFPDLCLLVPFDLDYTDVNFLKWQQKCLAFAASFVKVHYPKLYNMAHLLAFNVLLLPKDLTIIFICYYCSWCCAVWRP